MTVCYAWNAPVDVVWVCAGQAGEKKRWREGRDMWCDVCQVRYCLHCTEAMGTLVRWHDGKTCKEFMQEAENAKAAAERKRLEKIANEGCALAPSCATNHTAAHP